MKKYILTLFGLLTILCLSAQVTITTSSTHDKYQIVEGSYRTEVPLGSTYIDVNSSSQVAIKTIGTDKILVNYKTPSTYTINGSNYTNLDSCVKYLALATSLQLEYLVSNISGSGGDFIPLAGTDSLKPVTGTIEILSEGSGATYYLGEDPNTGYWGIISEGKERLVSPYGYYWFDKDFIQSTSISFDNIGGLRYGATPNMTSQGIYGQMNSKRYAYTDSSYVQKYYVDSVASGGGVYLPLNIQDSTTVELNGNSLIFQGENHSLALNRQYDALAIGGAVMDGFQAQQYDDILTMNGVMKIPTFFGDTIRYPVMFLSNGIPLSDTAKYAFLKGVIGYEFGFGISTIDEASENYTDYGFFNDKFIILKNDQSVFEIDLETGILTVTNEVIGEDYYPKTSAYSYAQIQDLARTIITNPSNNTLVNPATKEIVINIESDSVDIVLPDTTDCEFWHLYIKNNSSTAVTVKTENDEVAFWEGGVLSDEYAVPAGTLTHIIFDGENYLIK